jgi:hypothetical protein
MFEIHDDQSKGARRVGDVARGDDLALGTQAFVAEGDLKSLRQLPCLEQAAAWRYAKVLV